MGAEVLLPQQVATTVAYTDLQCSDINTLNRRSQEKGLFQLTSVAHKRLSVTFVTPDGDRTTLQVREGDSLLDIAPEHDIDLEGAVIH